MSFTKRIIPGQIVSWNCRTHVVLEFNKLDQAVIRDAETGKIALAPTVQLLPDAKAPSAPHDLMLIPDADWNEAGKRLQIIRPLLENGLKPRRTKEDVETVAREVGKNSVTIYRWIKRYEKTGLLSSLLRPTRNDRGKSRLSSKADEIISDVIETFYLSKQRHSITETFRKVGERFRAENLTPPHPNTVRARINQLPEKVKTSRRDGYKAARERFTPLRGSFPGAEAPLAVVQIDHTPVDLTLVDDVQRLPIGRPYLTIAIDVCTRMIAGFCITLEAPGAMSAGLCIAHAALPKETMLARHRIETSWPIWGLMRKIYVDNAKEFHGTMLQRACAEYGIEIEHRPKGQPNYGGTVERAFRTFMKKTHGIAGTTFSNIREKGDYDSDQNACMTLSEFERWLTIFVVEVYHQRPHKGIANAPPIKLYEQSILGTDDQPGIGLPQRVPDEQKLRLDFTPYIERTIQKYGVLVDSIHYYADALRPWIDAPDPKNPKLKRKFIFARDPRDISTVYFLDPETRTYSPVGYRDLRRPPMSLWELHAAVKYLAKSNIRQPNEELIFEAYRKMREQEDESIAKTKHARGARRNAQRRRGWSAGAEKHVPDISPPIVSDDYPDGLIQPFDDIEEAE